VTVGGFSSAGRFGNGRAFMAQRTAWQLKRKNDGGYDRRNNDVSVGSWRGDLRPFTMGSNEGG